MMKKTAMAILQLVNPNSDHPKEANKRAVIPTAVFIFMLQIQMDNLSKYL